MKFENFDRVNLHSKNFHFAPAKSEINFLPNSRFEISIYQHKNQPQKSGTKIFILKEKRKTQGSLAEISVGKISGRAYKISMLFRGKKNERVRGLFAKQEHKAGTCKSSKMLSKIIRKCLFRAFASNIQEIKGQQNIFS